MKKLHAICILIPVISFILFCGCQKESEPGKAKIEVELNGFMGPVTKAAINPAPGNLPPTQLSIGVAMLNYNTSDPATDQPDENAWKGMVSWRRAYFGGVGLGANPVTNGEIKFTNDAGTAIQKVFYDETGLHCFLRAVYPYDQAEVTDAIDGGMIRFNINGSQDVMCSNLGWGNMDHPLIHTLRFRHLLTKLNFKLMAEDSMAIEQYGEIKNIELIEQPNSIMFNLIDTTVSAAPPLTSSYTPVDFPSTPKLLTLSEADFGYVMVLPEQKYTFRIETTNRLWFYADITFSEGALPGKAYNITFKFLQADEIIIYAEEAKEWWMNSTFN